jgi:LemA protein
MIIAVIAAGVVIVLLILLYNSLVRKKNQVETAFSTIGVLLKKRFDLLPNLVKMVQRYMQHEADVLTELTDMRTKAVPGHMDENQAVDLDRKASQAIGRIMVAVENYPDLKASRNFLDLQGSLNELEEQISAARRAYNASVLDYNNAMEMFPSNIMAGLMRYRKKVFFEVAAQEKNAMDVGELFAS